MSDEPYYECQECGYVGYEVHFQSFGVYRCPDCGCADIEKLDGEDEEE